MVECKKIKYTPYIKLFTRATHNPFPFVGTRSFDAFMDIVFFFLGGIALSLGIRYDSSAWIYGAASRPVCVPNVQV
jgi:hypothetical protein